MNIDETMIRQWADRHECRQKLPILLRRLIRETTPSIEMLRFPGNEAVDLKGLDGQVSCSGGTTWVPSGASVWEVGCNQDPRAKAQSDFRKRTNETPEAERLNKYYIFVTPRRWPGKELWVEECLGENAWMGVIAYDAIDLETWLEQAPVTSRWFGEMLGVFDSELLTPQEWWLRWATASVPALSTKMVSTRRFSEADYFLTEIRGGAGVVSVQGDDSKEALAFVVATLIEDGELDLLDRTLVVTSENVKIPKSPVRLIIVVDVDTERDPDFGDRSQLTIVRGYPKSRSDVRGAIQLSHVPSDVFKAELESLGLKRDDVEKLSLRTGHSIPILRRQLSEDPEVRRPVWARDRSLAKLLIPFALAGAWVDGERCDDELVIQLLGEFEGRQLEEATSQLLAVNDTPIARYGSMNVVVSQLEALLSVGPFIGKSDLDRFFQLVPEILVYWSTQTGHIFLPLYG